MKNNQLTMGPGLPLVNKKGITIKELKDLVKDLPEVNPKTGEEYELWVMTGPGTSSLVKSIWDLNSGDLIFDSNY